MSNIPERIKQEIAKSRDGPARLELSNLGLNDADITELQELLQNKPNTVSLDLSRNNITAEGCKMLCMLRQLRTVNLSNNNLDDGAIEHLVATSINSLDVSRNGVNDVGAQKFINKLGTYTVLNIDANPDISDEISKTIRAKFIRYPGGSSSVLGIDLGLNIHNFLSDHSLVNGTTKSEASLLAERLFQAHEREIQARSGSQREEFVACLQQKMRGAHANINVIKA